MTDLGSSESLSIVIPAKNEAQNLPVLLGELCKMYGNSEIIVVNDGSTDDTVEACKQFPVTVISHPYSMGNGAAIKSGARHATSNLIVFMDADGQHNPKDISRFLEKMEEGYEMVIGARKFSSQASMIRHFANGFYNRLASFMTGHKIADLTSGFRLVRARHFKKFLYLLPNGFSYPTTSTMAFFRSGYPVAYVPIIAHKRVGKSHISLVKDGLRFFLIIIKIGTLFSPMRLFLPVSTALFMLGTSYYAYTYITISRFTNMSALLLTSALTIFLIGVLSEQISALHYKTSNDDRRIIQREKNSVTDGILQGKKNSIK